MAETTQLHHVRAVIGDDEAAIESTEIDTLFNVRPHVTGLSNVRLSKEIEQFLEERHESPQDVLSRPVVVPPEPDDSLPFSHYFISTSHNTYLLSYQLMGKADPSAYTRVLTHNCRCVEIDVWSGSNGPIVTHGWTWSDHLSFRDVCAAIGDAVRPIDWPLMVSLECHVEASKQDEIVVTMKEVWGEKLVCRPPDDLSEGEVATPRHFRGKILLMVEYYPPSKPEDTTINSSSSEESDSPKERATINPSLAELGIYARSVKPHTGWLNQDILNPRHIVYNLSEGALNKLIPTSLQPLVENALSYLRRVYPKGTRVTSANLTPHKHWASGTQISALNWQRYDRGLQLNEAMFVGSEGWVCKPDRLRGFKPFESRKPVRLTCEIMGGCNVPKPAHDIKAYIYLELFLPSEIKTWQSQARAQSSSLPAGGPTGDFCWNEKTHFDYIEEDIAFIRVSVYQEEWGKDDRLGTFCALVTHLQEGWRFVRLFNKKGKHNGGLLLVKLTYC